MRSVRRNEEFKTENNKYPLIFQLLMDPFSFLGLAILAIVIIFIVYSLLSSIRFLFFFLLAAMVVVFFFDISLSDVFRWLVSLLLIVF